MKIIITYSILFLILSTATTVKAQELVPGAVVGRHIFGLATDYQGDPVLIRNRPLIYEISSMDERISIEDKDYVISVFDHEIGGIYVTQINPESKKPVDTTALDMESVGGLSSPAGGTRTAWNTLLLTESRLIDAFKPQSFVESFKPYFKEKGRLVNPYNYGWISEVILSNSREPAKVIKNFSLGRLFASDVIPMPDGKTFYILDAGNNHNLYLFIAEQPNSLTKGTLYAAGSRGNHLFFAELGKTSSLKMKFKLKNMTFDALFQSAQPADQGCESGFKYVETVYGKECLKLRPANRNYAGLFEPVRMMAMLDTPGFSSGITAMKYDPRRQQIILMQSGGKEMRLRLGSDLKLESQYIIQESP